MDYNCNQRGCRNSRVQMTPPPCMNTNCSGSSGSLAAVPPTPSTFSVPPMPPASVFSPMNQMPTTQIPTAQMPAAWEQMQMPANQGRTPTPAARNQMQMPATQGQMQPPTTLPAPLPSFPETPSACQCIDNAPLAMAYVPMQRWSEPYNMERALERGTIFPELDLPFLMGRCQ